MIETELSFLNKRKYPKTKMIETETKKDNRDPLEKYKTSVNKSASIFSTSILNRLTHFKINKIINYSKTNNFDFDSLFSTHDCFKASNVSPKFESRLKKKKTVIKTVISENLFDFIFGNTVIILAFWVYIPMPYLVKELIEWLTDGKEGSEIDKDKGFMICGFLLLIIFLGPTLEILNDLCKNRLMVRSSVALKDYVAKRVMNVDLSSLKFLNVGKATNLITSDAYMISVLLAQSMVPLMCVGVIIGYGYLLWEFIGWISLLVPLVTFSVILFEIYLNRKVYKYEVQLLEISDLRGKKISEMVDGIKMIKFNAWENIVRKDLKEIRLKEKNIY